MSSMSGLLPVVPESQRTSLLQTIIRIPGSKSVSAAWSPAEDLTTHGCQPRRRCWLVDANWCYLGCFWITSFTRIRTKFCQIHFPAFEDVADFFFLQNEILSKKQKDQPYLQTICVNATLICMLHEQANCEKSEPMNIKWLAGVHGTTRDPHGSIRNHDRHTRVERAMRLE
jgi:hypothetical protein